MVILEDLVDDSVGAAPGCPETLELANEWLTETVRVGDDRSEYRLQGGVPYLGGQLVEVTETFGCDLRLVHLWVSDVVPEPQPLSLFRFLP